MIGGEVGFNQIVVLLALTAAESLRRLKTTFSSGGSDHGSLTALRKEFETK
jgi:hypothetical protein